jgi:hypothetical protein
MKGKNALSLPRHRVGFIGLLLFAALVSFTTVHGAETQAGTGDSYALAKGTNEFGLWAGGSPDSSTIFGNTEDRQLLLFALR